MALENQDISIKFAGIPLLKRHHIQYLLHTTRVVHLLSNNILHGGVDTTEVGISGVHIIPESQMNLRPFQNLLGSK